MTLFFSSCKNIFTIIFFLPASKRNCAKKKHLAATEKMFCRYTKKLYLLASEKTPVIEYNLSLYSKYMTLFPDWCSREELKIVVCF